MVKLTKEHISKGGYTLDKLKKELKIDDVNLLIGDIPHAYEVLS